MGSVWVRARQPGIPAHRQPAAIWHPGHLVPRQPCTPAISGIAATRHPGNPRFLDTTGTPFTPALRHPGTPAPRASPRMIATDMPRVWLFVDQALSNWSMDVGYSRIIRITLIVCASIDTIHGWISDLRGRMSCPVLSFRCITTIVFCCWATIARFDLDKNYKNVGQNWKKFRKEMSKMWTKITKMSVKNEEIRTKMKKYWLHCYWQFEMWNVVSSMSPL